MRVRSHLRFIRSELFGYFPILNMYVSLKSTTLSVKFIITKTWNRNKILERSETCSFSDSTVLENYRGKEFHFGDLLHLFASSRIYWIPHAPIHTKNSSHQLQYKNWLLISEFITRIVPTNSKCKICSHPSACASNNTGNSWKYMEDSGRGLRRAQLCSQRVLRTESSVMRLRLEGCQKPITNMHVAEMNIH